MLPDKFLARKPTAEDMEEHGKWLQKHWEYIKTYSLVPANVQGAYCKVFGKQPPATESLRVQHMLNVLAAHHGSTLTVVNTSQCISRACNSQRGLFPCVTPGGSYWLTRRHRYALPLEKLLVQNLPLDVMDVGCNTDRELHSLAGNSMHVRVRPVRKLWGMFPGSWLHDATGSVCDRLIVRTHTRTCVCACEVHVVCVCLLCQAIGAAIALCLAMMDLSKVSSVADLA